jgi:hypothetical protein
MTTSPGCVPLKHRGIKVSLASLTCFFIVFKYPESLSFRQPPLKMEPCYSSPRHRE